MQEEQVTEGTVDADQAIALTAVEEKDLAISEYKKKYEEILKLKRGMTFEIEALQSSLKAKEAGMYATQLEIFKCLCAKVYKLHKIKNFSNLQSQRRQFC